MDGNLEPVLLVQALRLQGSQLLMDKSTTDSLEKLSEQPRKRTVAYSMERHLCVSDLLKDITR